MSEQEQEQQQQPKPMVEFSVPLSVQETFKPEGKQSVVLRAPTDLFVDEVFVAGDIHKLSKTLLVRTGFLVNVPVPSKYTKESPCGIYAAVVDERFNILSRAPLGGIVTGEFESCPVTIAPQSTAIAQFTPESPSGRGSARFKRFAIAIEGDVKNLFLNDIFIGKQENPISLLPGQRGVIPFEMALREDAFHLPHVIAPGVVFHVVLSNKHKEQPVTLSGSLIFEEVAETRSIVPSNIAQKRN